MIALLNYTWYLEMTPSTIRSLNQLNQNFYQTTAAQFSVTRSQPWSGWNSLIEPLTNLFSNIDQPIKVLDIGCGNGRFASWLSQTWPIRQFEYLGIDFADSLLQETAELELPFVQVSTQRVDLVELLLKNETLLSGKSFDVVVAFGVAHHLPGESIRQRFFELLSKKLTNIGITIITCWQFDHLENLISRQHQSAEICIGELEKDDYLLDWQRGTSALRYCHLLKPSEVQTYTDLAHLRISDSFYADGQDDATNYYLQLQKSTSR